MNLLITLPVITAGLIYLVRKHRERTWGFVTSNSKLHGKVFIITGANTGLGYQTAKSLAKRGATVILACRDLLKANEAIESIKRETKEGNLISIELDLESFESIHAFCKVIKEEYPEFDCLINNAGLSMKIPQVSKQGIEIHTAVNHLGHFLLTHLLLDLIKKNNARIVIVSSKLHENGEINFESFGKIVESEQASKKSKQYYANSKLMNFYFAKELYKRGVDVHVCCPGFCYTDLFRDFKPRFYHFILFSPIILFYLRSAEQGAQNIIYCATDSENNDEKNPSNSYIVMNLQQVPSKHTLSSDISEKLWIESEKLCKLK